ncbi:MAG TPA: hypothetical protein VIX87_05200 [Steroidobacteraceae bacterium]
MEARQAADNTVCTDRDIEVMIARRAPQAQELEHFWRRDLPEIVLELLALAESGTDECQLIGQPVEERHQ